MEINTRWSATGVVFKETPFERIRDNYHGVGNFRFHIISQLLYTYMYIYISRTRRVCKEQKWGRKSWYRCGIKKNGRKKTKRRVTRFRHQLTKVFSLVSPLTFQPVFTCLARCEYRKWHEKLNTSEPWEMNFYFISFSPLFLRAGLNFEKEYCVFKNKIGKLINR